MKLRVTKTKNKLQVYFPIEFRKKRYRVDYKNNVLYLIQDNDGGNVITPSGNPRYDSQRVQFGKSYAVRMKTCTFEVESTPTQKGDFVIKIPELTEKPATVNRRLKQTQVKKPKTNPVSIVTCDSQTMDFIHMLVKDSNGTIKVLR